jgi:hypothetical protein
MKTRTMQGIAIEFSFKDHDSGAISEGELNADME